MKRPKHCETCGILYDCDRATARFCTSRCRDKFYWNQKRAGYINLRFCRQCGKEFQLKSRNDAARRHCSIECSKKSAKESRSKFYEKNPEKMKQYYLNQQKIEPDGNQKRFYRRYPNAPKSCQSCGEKRVLDIAHKPEFRRNGQWRSLSNSTLDKVWILCPTCHALLDRMNYTPEELNLR